MTAWSRPPLARSGSGISAIFASTAVRSERQFCERLQYDHEQACSARVERLSAQLADLRADRVGLQNAIDLEEHVPTRQEIEDVLAEIREMITSGTREDHKTLTSALVGPIRVEGRHSIQPWFIVPTQKVRVLSRLVLPGLHNKNLSALVKTAEIKLSSRHAKVRRGGYRLQ
jgi:hypothetical protein